MPKNSSLLANSSSFFLLASIIILYRSKLKEQELAQLKAETLKNCYRPLEGSSAKLEQLREKLHSSKFQYPKPADLPPIPNPVGIPITTDYWFGGC